ncbi:sigma-70 family RNA polymerase sigma factor [uncultured Sphingomonas sp.]|uniref:sigma-70 family RNA polymerase sigma factor n=1 Tax=uncultured Sphingomonas sp. TaxID=158754 RepID=UPI0035C9B566
MLAPFSNSVDDREQLAALLYQVAEGDRAALETLYRRTSARLFAVCRRALGDGHDAEEALQDAYLAVWQRAGSYYPSRGSPTAWLVVVARHCAIDRLRSLRRSPTVPIELAAETADDRPNAFDAASADRNDRRLHECLKELAAGDRAFIAAAFFQGETYSTLATREALPLGTVKSRIRRALSKLRACLE